MADEEVLWPLRAVSKDPTNITRLDADNNILTSTVDVDARYVRKAGDAMTGPLTVTQNAANTFLVQLVNGASYTKLNGGVFTTAKFGPRPQNDNFCTMIYSWDSDASNNYWSNDYSVGALNIGQTLAGVNTNKLSISSTGNLTAAGTAHSFAQGSIPSIAMGPLVLLTEITPTATIDRTDAGKVLVAAPPVNQDFTVTLPAAGAAGITTGTVIELVSNISSVGKYLFIQAPAGVSLFYNSTFGGSGDGTLGGGVAAKCRLRGPMTSARLLAVDGATWWIFGDLVPA
jgi:hypothetical protein